MTIAETARFLLAGDDYIISSHESTDADGLGAEYALARSLAGLGKRAKVVNAEPYAECYRFIDEAGIVGSLADAGLDEKSIRLSTAILLDTNDVLYTGNIADRVVELAADMLIIDHHEVKGGVAGKICSMPALSSTCEMVYRIIAAMGAAMPADVATALFAGIVYDTGSFAYSKTTEGTFEVALDLVRHGAEPSAIHAALYESSATSALLLRKDVMSTLELHLGNRAAFQIMTAKALKESGSSYEDAEGLINIPLQAASVEVSIFFKENEEGTLRCSLRSKGAVNVAHIAQSFGGGGHKRAAGFKSPFPLETIKSRMLELVEASLKGCE